MDYKNLPPELVKKLKDWESKRPEQQQLKVLADIANMTQELISVADDTGKATTDVSKQLSALGAVLDDSRQQLMQLNKKEAPESPDYAKPVVSALDRVIAEIKKQDIKPVFSPEIKVSSPKVELPKIDLKGIEKLLKTEIPKAFKDSIKLIPQTVIPEQDDAEMQLLIQELIAVTTEVRDKRIPIPQFPNKIAVTNPDGSLVGGSGGTTSSNISNDLFGSAMTATRYNQIEIDFSTTDPDAIDTLTVSKTTTGDATNTAGQATFSTGSNTNGSIKAVSTTNVTYRPHSEIYVAFTAIFSAGLASTYQRIGLYDTNDGVFVGFEGTSFGITKRSGAADTTVAQASFSEDTLTGTSTSLFTRNGTPEALDTAKDNLYRIRFGWLGAAPMVFEVFSPDGEWVVFHIIKHPNTATVPTIQNPNLPITLEAKKTSAGATVLTIKTACWAAGSTSSLGKVTDTVTDNTLASLNRSVIIGRSSSGGGTYYNVKVNPSGSLLTETATTNVYTKETGAYSIANKEATATYKYFGFQKSDGGWYIMRKTIATNIFEYVAGASAYSTAWTNRASQTYTDYATAF
jgi:hypothetical protein